MKAYILIYAIGTPLQGQPVIPALKFFNKDKALAIATLISREANGLKIEIHETGVIVAETSTLSVVQ